MIVAIITFQGGGWVRISRVMGRKSLPGLAAVPGPAGR